LPLGFQVSPRLELGSGHGFYVSSTPASGSSCSTFGTSSNPTSAVSNTPGFGSLSTPSFTFSFLPSFWKSTSTFPSRQFDPSCPSREQSSPFPEHKSLKETELILYGVTGVNSTMVISWRFVLSIAPFYFR
ncbi:unnamed protein product, partial [Prunus brigantina]